MKRIFSILFVVALLLGVGSRTVPSKEVLSHVACDISTKNSADISKVDAHWLSLGEDCTVVSGVRLLPQLSTRQLSFSSNAFRVKNYKQQVLLQLSGSREITQTRASYVQFDGYYLYHLRKLLI